MKCIAFLCNVGGDKISTIGTYGNHWALAVVDLHLKSITWGDSLGGKSPALLKEWLSERLHKIDIDISIFIVKTQQPYPLQRDGHMCGIITIVSAVVVCFQPNFFSSSINVNNPYFNPNSDLWRKTLLKWLLTDCYNASDILGSSSEITDSPACDDVISETISETISCSSDITDLPSSEGVIRISAQKKECIIPSLANAKNLNKESGEGINSISFNSEEQFTIWLKDLETNHHSFFFVRSSKKKEDLQISYYCCKHEHKDNAQCSAYITKQISCLSPLEIQVTYCLSHSHITNLSCLPLSKNLKEKIANKLNLGVTKKRILNDLRVEADRKSQLSRDDLITRREIHNIASYNQGKLSEFVNLKRMMKENRDIFFLKEQGQVYEGLLIDDFMVCFQSASQLKILKEFGKNLVCCDTTYKITKHDYMLITLLTVDTNNIGYPVAHCLATKENSSALIVFFKHIRYRLGVDLETECFMSDMANNFYVAWCFVFSKPRRRLYCQFHVLSAWKKRLNGVSKDKENNKEIEKGFYGLMYTKKESSFIDRLNQFLDKLKDDCPKFLSYFYDYYVVDSKFELWSCAYRQNIKVNTNNHLESFHKTFKYEYMFKRKNLRVDLVLSKLIEMDRDRKFEFIAKDVFNQKTGNLTYTNVDMDKPIGKEIEKEKEDLSESQDELDLCKQAVKSKCEDIYNCLNKDNVKYFLKKLTKILEERPDIHKKRKANNELYKKNEFYSIKKRKL